MITYIENPKEYTMNNYSKVMRYKVNIQKSIAFPYTSNKIELDIKNNTIYISTSRILRYKSNKMCARSM